MDQERKIGIIKKRLAVARGEQAADLLLTNAKLVNLFTSEIIETNLAIADGYIASCGDYDQAGEKVIDLEGRYLAPGLIDAHLHIESTLLLPNELAKVVVPRGTTAIISDPHEIANVLGLDGIKMLIAAAADLPCDFYFTVPSCVPATMMETAGAEISAADVENLINLPQMVALGEMMNYPGVIEGDEQVLAKIIAALHAGKPIDGHAPAVSGKMLQAYLSAQISTDHECLNAEEALEKLRNGMKIIIRHGSASSSLEALIPIINEKNVDALMFGSDDREAGELIEQGHFDQLLRTVVELGLDPLLALRIASLNPARHYRLGALGAIAPGFIADLVVFDDLRSFKVDLVIKRGEPVARNGEMINPIPDYRPETPFLQTINLQRKVEPDDFRIEAAGDLIDVIGVIPGQLVTEKLKLSVQLNSRGNVPAEPGRGLNKIAVVERHKGSGRIAAAMIQGLGLKRGALASSVAHDSHNIIVAGVEEKAMACAVNKLAQMGGGFVAVNEIGEVMAALPLPVAGLMAAEPAKQVATQMQALLLAASALGSELEQPFLTLAFMALPVIPALKITDRGLFDVDNFRFL